MTQETPWDILKFLITITIIFCLLISFCVLVSFFTFQEINNPKPNPQYLDEVVEWSGRGPCCDITWLEMCEDYKEAKNISFECFT